MSSVPLSKKMSLYTVGTWYNVNFQASGKPVEQAEKQWSRIICCVDGMVEGSRSFSETEIEGYCHCELLQLGEAGSCDKH
jgi:hypothetical protein